MKNKFNLALVIGGFALFYASMTFIDSFNQDILWKKIASGIGLLIVVCVSTVILLHRGNENE